ncbi:helix-turn-helix protein [Tamaricihabitans halophyticus]|uniref:Helix-turn-helix protein n=1 Tax=Tamaricihabitans halophyticus TaxID=1262583 RepID=A0A4R2QZV7_9PSEU|nr:helix-turn-helix transcriptional regulator [Tamaricihabitans halophyticus]TCP54934.1 helix-turn-helix protein [Tamaricihabitans halophyticus]
MARPSLRRRRLAGALRGLREAAKLDTRQAAERAGWSQGKVHTIETMKVGINGDDTHVLCKVYGADQPTIDALVRLAREARRKGWWHVYDDEVLDQFADFIELEEDARRVCEFEADVIPGALQTEGYASAVIGRVSPAIDGETIAQRVAVRMQRQERILASDTELQVVIDEAAILRPVGGRVVMAEQLDHLISVAARPRVSVQVLPLDVKGHAAMGLPFTLISLRDGAEYVYRDSARGGSYSEEPQDIEAYRRLWAGVQVMALDLDRSSTILERTADQHRSATNDDHP